jgi:hypothetical protein
MTTKIQTVLMTGESDDDAAAPRALANSVRKSDPGFASDLYAAADRHEREREAPGR